MKFFLILFILAIDTSVHCVKYVHIKSCYSTSAIDQPLIGGLKDLVFVCTENPSKNGSVLSENENEKCEDQRIDGKYFNEVRFENCERPNILPKVLKDFNMRSLNVSNLELQLKDLDLECSVDYHHDKDGLKYLQASGNQLIEISVDFLKNCFDQIQTIDLSRNEIQNITRFEQTYPNELLNLTYLNVSHNALSTIGQHFVPTSSLLILDLSYNQIKNVDEHAFDKNYDLIFLDLSHNLIKQLHNNVFANLTHLKQLNVSHNVLSTIEQHFVPTSSLLILDLSYNQIKNVDEHAFDKNCDLIFLDLSYNLIKQLHYNVFANLTHLKQLNLSHNNIYNIEPHTFFAQINLKRLDLSYNNIVTVKGNMFMESTEQMEFISLKYNPVFRLDELAHSTYEKIVGVDFAMFECINSTTDSIKNNCKLKPNEKEFIKKANLEISTFNICVFFVFIFCALFFVWCTS